MIHILKFAYLISSDDNTKINIRDYSENDVLFTWIINKEVMKFQLVCDISTPENNKIAKFLE